jgi:RNA polymerase sigma-70 factor (ECF subfamily)
MEGLPVEEAARVLDCPTGTVKSRCARGRARLAGLLAEAGITGTRRPPPPSHGGGRPGGTSPAATATDTADPTLGEGGDR